MPIEHREDGARGGGDVAGDVQGDGPVGRPEGEALGRPTGVSCRRPLERCEGFGKRLERMDSPGVAEPAQVAAVLADIRPHVEDVRHAPATQDGGDARLARLPGALHVQPHPEGEAAQTVQHGHRLFSSRKIGCEDEPIRPICRARSMRRGS